MKLISDWRTLEGYGEHSRVDDGLTSNPTITLFRRAVFAWLIADGDMHLKNLAVLKRADVGAKTFTTVPFGPLCDAVTTRVFPGLAGDRMVLKLNGKDDRLTRQDFLGLARTIGLTVEDAEAGLDALTTRITERPMTLQLPH